MALSNIFREPRREITESAIGLAMFGAWAFADYEWALTFQNWCGGRDADFYFGLFLGIPGTIGIVGILLLTHEAGGKICDGLQQAGIHLRPRNRPGNRK